MITQYFEGLTTESEIKARYKELAKTYHPDLGGDVETMKLINLQYEKVITGAYQKAGKSISEIEELLAQDNALKEKINQILSFDGLHIEICGCWLWLTGDTRTYKDFLKKLGFFWANKKKAWYWRAAENRSHNRKSMDLDEIRQKHGSLNLNNIKRKVLA